MFNFRARRWALMLSGACFATSALAGAGDLVAEVIPLSPRVTYSDPAAVPALETYVAYTVRLTNNTPNTINRVTLRFSLSGSDIHGATLATPGAVLLGSASQLPDGCAVSSATTIDCSVGKMTGNATFPASGSFVPLYKAPAAASGVVKLTSNVRVVYAESLNGSNPNVNSAIDIGQVAVDLGTDNPASIKSALPKSGGSLRTGVAGVPTDGNRATEIASVPAVLASTSFARATIDVLLASTADCLTQGRFYQCPAFTTSVRDEAGALRVFPAAQPLALTYRVHPLNLKLSAAKVLNSVLIYYVPDGALDDLTGRIRVQDICPTATSATGTGTPCIASAFCYKRSTPGWTPALDGVCEWNLNNTRNGLLKLD